jgi:peptidoglycan hydrolase-like protein with peptidoglycan-binding domain
MKAIRILISVLLFVLGATSVEAKSPVIKKGSSDKKAVKEIQAQLIARGYMPRGLETGKFLSITDKAVRKFQRDNGLPVTGNVGPATRAAFNKKPKTNKKPATAPVIKKEEVRHLAIPSSILIEKNQGVSTENVREAQKALRVLGQRNVPINGLLERNTISAIQEIRNGWGPLAPRKGEINQDVLERIVKQGKEKEKTERKAKAYTPRSAHVSTGKVLREKKTKATVFGNVKGKKDRQDSGRGTPLLNPAGPRSGLNTNYASCVGAALPIEIIAKEWDIEPIRYVRGKAIWSWEDFRGPRMAGLQLQHPVTGRWLDPVPLKDVGPGKGPQSRGVEVDLCAGTNRAIGGDGLTEVRYRLIANVFPERGDGRKMTKKTTTRGSQKLVRFQAPRLASN